MQPPKMAESPCAFSKTLEGKNLGKNPQKQQYKQTAHSLSRSSCREESENSIVCPNLKQKGKSYGLTRGEEASSYEPN